MRRCSAQFTPLEIANLTTLIGMINLWNRIGVGFRLQHPVPAEAAGGVISEIRHAESDPTCAPASRSCVSCGRT